MPYMYCNQEGCNETVKLPAQYCVKHAPFEQDIKASDPRIKVDVDKVSKSMNTKKTTK